MTASNNTLQQLAESATGNPTRLNENFDAMSQAATFGRNPATTTGLTWGYLGGSLEVDGTHTTVASGTVALTASQTNYVEATRAGVVSANTSGFTAGRLPLYVVTTGASSITAYADHRRMLATPGIEPMLTKSVAGAADVTLTAAEARCAILKLTGALTGNINVVVPAGPQRWTVANATSGAFSLTVKTAAGSGAAIAQGTSANVYADGANVVTLAAASDAADVTYTPTAAADWSGSADPGNVDQALDQLAARVAGVEAAGGGSVATDAIWNAKGDLAAGTGPDTADRLAVGTDGTVLIADASQPTGMRWGSPGSASLPGSGWAQYLAASLEPDAIEALQINGFSYAVASNATKLLLASWQTRLGSSGRMEVRDPGAGFLPLRGVTLAGTGAGSVAVLVNPALPTYADPWSTYYNRLEQVCELKTRFVNLTAASDKQLLLPGPYGSIITHYTVFDLPWLCVRPVGGTVIGYNLGDEESDTDGQRVGRRLLLAVNKGSCSAIHADDTADGSPSGSVTWVNCPADWGAIADPNTYLFRDTFEAAALDTGVWTVVQSAGGNIAIDANYNWLLCKGNSAWGNNAVFKTAGIARSAQPTLIVDFASPFGTDWNGSGCIGWHDGAGASNTDILHGVNISAKSGGTGAQTLTIQEGATNKSTGGVTVTPGSIYRLRITALAAGGATYQIQGGTEFPAIGGSSWTTLSPSGGSSGSAATLHPGVVMFSYDTYIGDVRVI